MRCCAGLFHLPAGLDLYALAPEDITPSGLLFGDIVALVGRFSDAPCSRAPPYVYLFDSVRANLHFLFFVFMLVVLLFFRQTVV